MERQSYGRGPQSEWEKEGLDPLLSVRVTLNHLRDTRETPVVDVIV